MLELLVNGTEVCEMVTLSSETPLSQIEEFGLQFLGSGVSREVYKLSESHVLKVQTDAWGVHETANANEVALWQALTEEERDAGTFARVYLWADDYSWVISELIPHIGRDNRTAADRELYKRFGVGDLHGGNYGTREDGSWAIIDYGVSGERGSRQGRATGSNRCSCGLCGGCGMTKSTVHRTCAECGEHSNYCGAISCGHCGDCNCEWCAPEGCMCESWEGCNRRTCEDCDERNANRRKLARDSRLPTFVRNRLAVGGWADDAETMISLPHANYDVCRAHANERRGIVATVTDTAQIEMAFSNRYDIGLRIETVWQDGKMVTLPFYYVRDRFNEAKNHRTLEGWQVRNNANFKCGAEGFALVRHLVNVRNGNA